MDISENKYKIVFTNDCIKEMDYIYSYISNNLYAINSAKRLMREVEKEIKSLKFMPEKYRVIKKIPELYREYRRIIVKNYVIIYIISKEEQKIYIVHMFYGGSNYLDNL